MQDDKTSWALTKALTAEQLAWWQDRMRRTLAHVRHRFPKARLVLRKQHRVDEALKGTPYITNLRVHQLRHLQEEIARSEGLPTFGQLRAGAAVVWSKRVGAGANTTLLILPVCSRLQPRVGGISAVPGASAPDAGAWWSDVCPECAASAAGRDGVAQKLAEGLEVGGRLEHSRLVECSNTTQYSQRSNSSISVSAVSLDRLVHSRGFGVRAASSLRFCEGLRLSLARAEAVDDCITAGSLAGRG